MQCSPDQLDQLLAPTCYDVLMILAVCLPESETSQWLMVSEAFMRMFIEIMGHFGEHITTQQDGRKVFEVSVVYQIYYLVVVLVMFVQTLCVDSGVE